MRILVLGGSGMLGHQLYKSWHARHDVRVTLRGAPPQYESVGLFTQQNAFFSADVRDSGRIKALLDEFKPDAVVNAVGIIKQRKTALDAIPCLEINALFPHRLCELCDGVNARLVHISTDCVFSGERGAYTEKDRTDVSDLYGLTKYLGEVHDPPAVTLRTSIIGLELQEKASLVEWFLSQHGVIRGFTKAIYTGVTTQELARVIEDVLTNHQDLAGLWQVATAPISKFDLLRMLARYLGRTDISIEPDDEFQCDRSLVGDAFANRANYSAPTWDSLLKELAHDIIRRDSSHVAA